MSAAHADLTAVEHCAAHAVDADGDASGLLAADIEVAPIVAHAQTAAAVAALLSQRVDARRIDGNDVLLGIRCDGVLLVDGGQRHQIGLRAAVGEAAHGLVAVHHAVRQRIHPFVLLLVRVVLADSHIELFGGGVGQLKVGVNLRVLRRDVFVAVAAPDQLVAMSGNDGGGLRMHGGIALGGRRDLPLGRIISAVGDAEAGQIDVLVGGVVELYPVILLKEVVDVNAVAGTHLIDDDGRCGQALFFLFFVGQRLPNGLQVVVARSFELHFRIGVHNLSTASAAVVLLERSVEIDVRRRATLVVHLDGNHVLSFLKV